MSDLISARLAQIIGSLAAAFFFLLARYAASAA